ncbi:hypothetical protein QQP08_026775 [Theobroma cacao]|nr:hypothetical protein QQP08_026775 [Theobroma cacao]
MRAIGQPSRISTTPWHASRWVIQRPVMTALFHSSGTGAITRWGTEICHNEAQVGVILDKTRKHVCWMLEAHISD